jgi:hypothetical protein
MFGRGTNRGGRTLSSQGRYSTGRGRIVVQVTPTLSRAQTTPSPHINTIPSTSPSPTQTPTLTPTPSTTIPPNRTPNASTTIPQNSEHTLPHTQSSTIEPDDDEGIDQEGLDEIEPYGNEYIKYYTFEKLTFFFCRI